MGGIRLEHADHEVRFSKEVIDDNNSHVARVKSSPGGEALNVTQSIYSVLNHYVSGLAGLNNKRWLPVELGDQGVVWFLYVACAWGLVSILRL